jgi:hypothetical protein
VRVEKCENPDIDPLENDLLTLYGSPRLFLESLAIARPLLARRIHEYSSRRLFLARDTVETAVCEGSINNFDSHLLTHEDSFKLCSDEATNRP